MSTANRRPMRAAKTASAKKPGKPVVTYWLTRDMSAEGVLSDVVDVWLARPSRKALPGGVGATWICDDVETVAVSDGDVPARFTTWTLAECSRTCRVYPDDDRMCIRIDGAYARPSA